MHPMPLCSLHFTAAACVYAEGAAHSGSALCAPGTAESPERSRRTRTVLGSGMGMTWRVATVGGGGGGGDGGGGVVACACMRAHA